MLKNYELLKFRFSHWFFISYTIVYSGARTNPYTCSQWATVEKEKKRERKEKHQIVWYVTFIWRLFYQPDSFRCFWFWFPCQNGIPRTSKREENSCANKSNAIKRKILAIHWTVQTVNAVDHLVNFQTKSPYRLDALRCNLRIECGHNL